MRLYEEIVKSELGQAFSGARVLYLPMQAAYFEGVKALGDFTEERVEILFPKCRILVEGEGLSIGKLYAGDLCVLGRIRSLTALGEVEKG